MKGGEVDILLIFSLCISSVSVFADNSLQVNSSIVPYNVIIASMSRELTIDGNGKLKCYAKTSVPYGYVAETTVELQKYENNKWQKVTSWNIKKDSLAIIDEYRYASKGYSYQLKVTHKGYNANNKLLESFELFSSTVAYK